MGGRKGKGRERRVRGRNEDGNKGEITKRKTDMKPHLNFSSI
jgi:hypothetical protein